MTFSSIIRTKLHRPPVAEEHVHRPNLMKRLERRRHGPVTLASAPAGYGKTTLIACWLEMSDSPSAWVSLDENDNDLRQFLTYFLAAIQAMFSEAGRKTLSLLNALMLPPVSEVARDLINDLDRIEQPFILVLDDFHRIRDQSVLDLLTELLRHPPKAMHLVLSGRRDPSLPISRLRAAGLMKEIRTRDLRFDEVETETFLRQVMGMDVDSSTVAALHRKTEGWVTGLRLAALSRRHRDSVVLEQLKPHLTTQYVSEYLFAEVFSIQSQEIRRYLLGTAILDRFCGPLCEAVRGEGADPQTFELDGWGFIKWLQSENMFLIPIDAENRWFRYHHLFQELLLSLLERHSSPEDINVLHARASDWFADEGLIEEALKHALAGGSNESAARLIANHGFDLLDKEQWPRLERWLRMLPASTVDQHPELLALMSWLHLIYARHTELMSSLDKALTQSSLRTIDKPTQGHLDVLHSFRQYMAANGEHALIAARRALEKIPRSYRWARIFSYLVQAGTHHMLGDRENALSTIDEAMRDPDLMGGTSQAYFQANPCFLYWMDADLTSLLQTARQALSTGEVSGKFQAIAHGYYFLGIAHYHRNELHAAEENLRMVVKNPFSQHALNYAHSAFALALVCQAQSREDEANQVGEAVVSYGLEANNSSLLHLARAFKAELAFRQKRFGEASRWAAQYQAYPFLPAYRFYMPQLTAAKILLAEERPDRRHRADDLLQQLYDFLRSIHNTRFLIDVLALQALRHDMGGDEAAAMRKLTEALDLSEPGGFIRLFVDLGPQMADLLRRLVQQNIAVGYIGRILAAFRDDKHQASFVESVYPGSHLPSEISQPLVEPLTKRELQILEILSKRLSNKEIAAKLFISPETVKKHLNNIYGKLNVTSRRQAVEKAKALGMMYER